MTAAGVAAFGAGVVSSMVGAVLAARLAGRLAARSGLDPGPRLARGLVGAGSVVVGCGWIWASW